MQSINFYLDSYQPKPLSFDSRFAGFTLVVSLLGLLSIGWIQSVEVSDLNTRLTERRANLALQQQQLAEMTKELKKQAVSSGLEEKLILMQQELNNYQNIISLANLPLTYTPVNFSQILSDLSQNTVDFLWLTKIDIETNNLSLSGATTDANFIPVYLEQLKTASSLKRYFDELKIERQTSETKIVNFELVNGRLLDE